MEDLKKVSQQFINAANVMGTPQTSIPELSSYFKAAVMDPIVSGGLAGGAVAGSQAARTKEEQEEAARKQRLADLQNKADPENFRKERKADGGYAFYDPEGNEISINDYAAVTGQRRVDILSDSENPVDQEYIRDWQNMNELAQAFYDNDQGVIQQFTQANPNLKDMKPRDFMSELIKKYPHIYGYGGSGGDAYQQTLQNRGMRIFSPYGEQSGGGAASTGGWRPS